MQYLISDGTFLAVGASGGNRKPGFAPARIWQMPGLLLLR
jgi:hypothetical protein